MKKQLHILEVEDRVSKKSGNKYRVAQCIVKGDNIRVGELMIFKPDLVVAAGEYEADFDVSVNFDKQVGAELVALRPLSRPSASAAK